MILRAQIFISTVFAQPKFLPEGPLLLILENIYVCIFQIQICSKKGLACPKTASGSAKRSSVSALGRASPLILLSYILQAIRRRPLR